MRKTTLYFEGNNPTSPTVYDNLDPGFIKRASAMIAGFEIEITKMEAVFKLSQDRDQESYQNIINHLNSLEGSGAAHCSRNGKEGRRPISEEVKIRYY